MEGTRCLNKETSTSSHLQYPFWWYCNVVHKIPQLGHTTNECLIMCIVNDVIAYYIHIISGPYQEIELAEI